MKTDPKTLKAFLDIGGSPNVIFDDISLVHGMSLDCLKVIHSNSPTNKVDIDKHASGTRCEPR
jgi:hypothetical protein